MSNPIDRETGYDDTVVCECKPCTRCEAYSFWGETCPHCKGTETDSQDCPIHVDGKTCCMGYESHQIHDGDCGNTESLTHDALALEVW